jgi:MFS family permease
VDDNWLNPVTLGLLFVLGGFLVGYTILHCKRVAHPVVDLSLFGIRTFRIGVLQVFLGLLAGGGIPFLVAVMLQAQLGYTPLESGLVLFVGAVGALMVKPMVSFLVQRLGFRCVLAGCPLGFAAVMGLLSTVQEQTPFVVLALFMFLFGCCQSVFMNMANAVPFLDVTEEKSSRATSLQGTLQQFSMSLGVTFAALLLHGWLAWEQVTLGDHSQTQLILGSFHWTFRILALVSLVNVFPALSWRDKEKTIEEQPVGVHLDRNR